MIDWIIILWLIVFVIFLSVNIGADSSVFGIVGGFWLLILGVGIIWDGVQIQDGLDLVTSGDTTTVAYSYVDAVIPVSTVAFIWGVILILISIFMIYSNAEDL